MPMLSSLPSLPDAIHYDQLISKQLFAEEAERLTRQIAAAAQSQNQCLVTAESCTGGWIAQQLSSIAGSSAWFDGGLVTYSNEAKMSLLGVDSQLLRPGGPGAVSKETVLAMTAGALAAADGRAHLAVAVSGIAGPDGGTPAKPVGTVWIAWQDARERSATRFCFAGDRTAVRQATVLAALQGLSQLLRATD